MIELDLVEVKDKVFKKFISREKIDLTVAELAGRINHDYSGKNPLLLGILNGAFIFAAD